MLRRALLVLLALLVSSAALAQPSISSATGTLSHGNSVTLSGSNFGTRTTITQAILDHAEGTNVGTLWGVFEPTTASMSTCNLAYRTPIRSVSLPYTHASNTKYLAGCHMDADTFSGGNDVYVVTPARTITTYPNVTFISWYWRMDPNWVNFCCGAENADGNNKIHGYGTGPSLNDEGSFFWYTEYDTRPIDSSVVPNIDVADNGNMGYRCVTATTGVCHSGHGAECTPVQTESCQAFANTSGNPINGWRKIDMVIFLDRTTSGSLRIYEDGVKVLHTTGNTDQITSTSTRYDGIGWYSRARGIDTWRYFDDIDFRAGVDAAAVVFICPGSTFVTRGVCETQQTTSWAASSITFTVNQASLGTLSTRYVYVCDRTWSCNSSGFLLNAVGGAAPTPMRRFRRSVSREGVIPIVAIVLFAGARRLRRVQ